MITTPIHKISSRMTDDEITEIALDLIRKGEVCYYSKRYMAISYDGLYTFPRLYINFYQTTGNVPLGFMGVGTKYSEDRYKLVTKNIDEIILLIRIKFPKETQGIDFSSLMPKSEK